MTFNQNWYIIMGGCHPSLQKAPGILVYPDEISMGRKF